MNTYTITVAGRTLTVNINDTQVIDLVGAAPPCAMAMDDNVVLVTEAFEQLTEQTRNAILTHEVAHMVLHLDVVKSTDQVVNDPNIEAEADAWAVKNGADMASALDELADATIRFMDSQQPGWANLYSHFITDEVKTRVHAYEQLL